jgi:hypothetical protein
MVEVADVSKVVITYLSLLFRQLRKILLPSLTTSYEIAAYAVRLTQA